MSDPLLQPLRAGALLLPNRIVMAPLTRCRASAGRVPNKMMAAYYAQRATFGLILSEATAISSMGVGYPDTPGIWSDEQIEGWQQVTRAVHDAGGLILLQLWHVGRISDPVYLDDHQPVAPSAIQPKSRAAPEAGSSTSPPRRGPRPRASGKTTEPAQEAETREGLTSRPAVSAPGAPSLFARACTRSTTSTTSTTSYPPLDVSILPGSRWRRRPVAGPQARPPAPGPCR